MKEPLVERLRSEVMWWSGGHERLLNQAIDEIVRLQAELDQVKRTWIEPKPVTRQSKSQGSTQRWPFMDLHDHEHQAVTGISIPETPV